MIQITKPFMGPEEEQAAVEAIRSGWVTQGPRVAAFEAAVAAYSGARHAVAVSNCTTALHLALLVAGVGPGDEVICPSLSFIATANAVRHCGATPVFADVREDDFNLDPDAIGPLVTERTRAILPVHQLGMPARMDAICGVAQRHRLAVIEDAACALGSSLSGRRIGSPFGSMVCFSFHPRKVISTGEGGMITTDDDEAARRLRLLRQHGMSVSDTLRHASTKAVIESYLCVGYNYRLTDIQAAIGIEQLKRLDWIVQRRVELAGRYNDAFSGVDGLSTPRVPEGVRFNYQSYALLLGARAAVGRDALMQLLLDRGIATRRGVMTAHREPAYASARDRVHLPVSERVSDNSILLPLYPQMTDSEQRLVIDSLSDALATAQQA